MINVRCVNCGRLHGVEESCLPVWEHREEES